MYNAQTRKHKHYDEKSVKEEVVQVELSHREIRLDRNSLFNQRLSSEPEACTAAQKV